MMYNCNCLDEQNIRAICLLNAETSAIKYCGQRALHDRTTVLTVRLSSGSNHGGHFVMVKKKRGVYNKVKNICQRCNKEFYTYESTKRKYCSRDCYLAIHTSNKIVDKVCQNCGITFSVYKSDIDKGKPALYCSTKCFAEAKTTPTVINKCLYCQKEIVTCEARINNNRGKFCSKKCYGLYKSEHSGINKICPVCGKKYKVSPYLDNLQYTCSQSCGKTSSRNPQWQGGHTKKYGNEFTRKLRKRIRTRDNYTCFICKENGSDVHHIDYNKFNNDENNLITLCHSCHSGTNTNREYWKMRFTGEMIKDGSAIDTIEKVLNEKR